MRLTESKNTKRSNRENDTIITTGRGGENAASAEEVSTQDSAVGLIRPLSIFRRLKRYYLLLRLLVWNLSLKWFKLLRKQCLLRSIYKY
jgi:hypothetical protein